MAPSDIPKSHLFFYMKLSYRPKGVPKQFLQCYVYSGLECVFKRIMRHQDAFKLSFTSASRVK